MRDGDRHRREAAAGIAQLEGYLLRQAELHTARYRRLRHRLLCAAACAVVALASLTAAILLLLRSGPG